MLRARGLGERVWVGLGVEAGDCGRVERVGPEERVAGDDLKGGRRSRGGRGRGGEDALVGLVDRVVVERGRVRLGVGMERADV